MNHTLRDIPEEARPRSRAFLPGPAAMTTEELLAAIVGGSHGLTAARSLALLSLVDLAALSPRELVSRPGVSESSAAAILCALELGRRMASGGLTGRDLLNEPALVKDYLRRARGDGTQERTGALFLNARNRLLADDSEIYRGTLDRAVVEPREILKRALLANAAGVILYHNHPSGDASPSREDKEFTRRLAAAADSIGLRLLDHVVVGREGCVSFREAGLM